MKIVGLKITAKAKMQVSWTQEAANGVVAKYTATDACKPQDGMVEAMTAVVPHVAKVLGLDAGTAANSAFAGITIAEKEDRKTKTPYTVAQVTLALPSPNSPKPAAAKTDRLIIEDMDESMREAIEGLERQAQMYVKLVRQASVA